jgi:hypothetical protein
VPGGAIRGVDRQLVGSGEAVTKAPMQIEVAASTGPEVDARISPVPILAAFALHGDGGRVLGLDPGGVRPRAVGRVDMLRYDAFRTKPAGVRAHRVAVLGDVIVEHDPGFGPADQVRPLRLHVASDIFLSPNQMETPNRKERTEVIQAAMVTYSRCVGMVSASCTGAPYRCESIRSKAGFTSSSTALGSL